jgi:peptidoglycan/LPS O-acetylase OafA/YrhL
MAPRSATWLLGCLLCEADKDAVIGDLIEEHALRYSSSSRHVSWWYWNQVSRSVLPLVWTAVRRGRWLGVLGAALAAYVLVTIIESAATMATFKLFSAYPLVQERAGLVIGLAAMALGGYIAASIRRGAAATLAVIIALVVVALMMTMSESVPLWYTFGFLVFGPLASLAGGDFWRRRHCEKRAL